MHRRDFLAHCAGSAAAIAAGASAAHASPRGALASVAPDAAHGDTTESTVSGADRPAATDHMAWWHDAKFGMFIHFGLYSEPGGEWQGRLTGAHEWMRDTARIPREEYDQLATRFNPRALDADAWVRAARDAGQRYVVFTTKHHEGFSLFPSAVSRHTVAQTPYRRDICDAVARACRRHGLKLGWYYSIMDWHHPDYRPMRPWEPAADAAAFPRYVAFMQAQLRELLTRYGDVSVLWFDGQWESTWTHAAALELEAYCRRLMPGVIINDRIDVAPPESPPPGYRRAGDYTTPELRVPEAGLPGQAWETCMTMNGNWGFAKDDANWKSVPALVSLLVETVSKGGNLLLNVGPDGSGRIPAGSLDGLAGMGAWLRTNGAAIHGTRPLPADMRPQLRSGDTVMPLRGTRTERTVNLVLPEWRPGSIELPAALADPQRVHLLGAPALPIGWQRTPDGLTLTLPERGPSALQPVVQLRMSGRS